MWWDLTGITLFDSVLFSILTTLILCLVGFGILRFVFLLTKGLVRFDSFDFFQKLNFNIISGFIFVFLIVLIFSALSLPFFDSTLVIIAFAAVGLATTLYRKKLKLPEKKSLQKYVLTITVIVILSATIFLSSMLITGFFGSTNDDGAYHTSMVRIILDHPTALLTRNSQPFPSLT